MKRELTRGGKGEAKKGEAKRVGMDLIGQRRARRGKGMTWPGHHRLWRKLHGWGKEGMRGMRSMGQGEIQEVVMGQEVVEVTVVVEVMAQVEGPCR